MKIAQVGALDTVGSRFNGGDLHKGLRERGYDSVHFTWKKSGHDPDTCELGTPLVRWGLYYGPRTIEKIFSLQSLFSLVPLRLLSQPHFRDRDVVHYQIIHNNFFSIAWLPLLSRIRPSVWTLHDMWAFTGHCIHSYSCDRWLSGCGECPDLASYVSMKHDRTRLMWNAKKKLYKRTRIDIIVASNWMESRVKQSPLLQDHRVHVVPFGVDTTVFSPQDKVYARKRLGIETHTTVLGFRSSDFPTKGLSILKSALFALNTQQPSTLLTLDQRGLVGDLAGKFKIIECGWVQDGLALRDIYSAMDIFVIPSLAESFCLMAVEAMACGVPVISFDSTPIPELFSQERGGIAVPYANAVELEVAIRSLAENQQRRNELGKAARLRAVTCYGFQEHVNRVLEVYTEVENRRKAKSQ